MSYLQSIGAKIANTFSSNPGGTSTATGENPNANMNFQNNNQNTNQGNQNPPAQNSSNTPPAATTPVDPLAGFSKMYDNATAPEAAPVFNLDSAQLQTVANGQDFTRGIDPALLERANNGDSKALIAMMQEVGRNAYQNALSHGSKLTEGFVTAREGHSAKGLSGSIRSELTTNALVGTQNFDNPVVRKQLISVAQDLQRQHPDASPQEIASEARRYITELANAINKPAETPAAKAKQGQTNWDNWFDGQ